MSMRLPVRLRGTGMYVPADIRDNASFAEYLETSDEWIVTRTGIRQRHFAAPEQATSDLALAAARRALEDAGLTPEQLDVIICATATGDYPFPATAVLVQAGLGLDTTPAFDISAACAGFLFGSVISAGFISSGIYRNALVIGAETLSRSTDPQDRTTRVLFGDAAGAGIYERSDDPEQGILYCDMGCEGARADHIWVPAGGSRLPTTQTTFDERLHHMRMKGREVYKFAVTKMQELIDRALETTGLTPRDLKLVIPHQSNLRIIESVREKMDLPRERISVNIDRYGNTSAASVIMALDEARRAGRLVRGDLVLMVAIGAGLTWSTMIIRL